MTRPHQFMTDSDFEHEKPVNYDGPTRRFLQDRGFVSPDYVLAKVTDHKEGEVPQWWGLDDVVILVANSKGFKSSKMPEGSWNIVPTETLHRLKGVFMDMGIGHRLKVRDLPPSA